MVQLNNEDGISSFPLLPRPIVFTLRLFSACNYASLAIESIWLAMWRYVTLCAVLSPALNHLNYIPGIPCRPYAVAVTRARCIAGWRANYELLSEWIIVVVNGHHTAPARFRACRVMRRNIAPASLGGDGRDVSMCRMIFSRVRAQSRAVTIIERIELYHVSNNHRDCKRIRMYIRTNWSFAVRAER